MTLGQRNLILVGCLLFFLGVATGLILPNEPKSQADWRDLTPEEFEARGLYEVPPLIPPTSKAGDCWGWKINSEGWLRYQQLPRREFGKVMSYIDMDGNWCIITPDAVPEEQKQPFINVPFMWW